MNKNNHATETDHEEECVDECVLEVRRIREEIYRERAEMRRKLGPRAFIDYLNKDAGTVTGNVRNTPPPPRPFPPSQRFLDFVAMCDRRDEEEQRRFDAAAARRAKASARRARTSTGGRRTKATTGAVAAVHAGV